LNKSRLLIGPENCSEQAYRWAKSVSPDIEISLSIGPQTEWDFSSSTSGRSEVTSRRLIRFATNVENHNWWKKNISWVTNNFSHVIIDYFNPIINCKGFARTADDIALLQKEGIKVALLAHGSDLILPSIHTQIERYSPHKYLEPELNAVLESHARKFNDFVKATGCQLFVSTLNLKVFQPNSIWLPVIASGEYFRFMPKKLNPIPLVVHLPSDPRFKGTAIMAPEFRRLAAKGIIRYFQPDKLNSKNVRKLIQRADIVFDQVAFGSYGVLGAEAMAAGKIVVGHVNDDVRAGMLGEIPILEVDPDTLEFVIRGLLLDQDKIQSIALESFNFANKYHNGSYSRSVMVEKFLI
jgi:hypothetical protein